MVSALYDFSNPVVSAVLTNRDGTRMPLWPEGNRGTQGSVEFLLCLSELKIELGISYIPTITASVSAPYDEGLKLINSDMIEYGYTLLEAQLGYVGSDGSAVLTPIFSGLVTKPEVRIGEDVTIDFKGQAQAGYSGKQQGRGQAFENLTPFTILRMLILGPDLANPRPVELDFSMVEKLASGKPAYQCIFNNPRTIAPGYLSDWHMFLKILRESYCWAVYVGNKIYIVPIDSAVTAVPTYEFMLFPGAETLGPASGKYPIYTFNSPTAGVYYPASLRGAVMRNVNDKTGKTNDDTLSVNSDVKDTKGGKPVARTGSTKGAPKPSPQHPGANPVTKDGQAGAHSDQTAQSDTDKIRSAIASSLHETMGMRVEIATLGVPDILPGATFKLSGLGDKFDYNYTVFEVVHTLGGDGFSTNLVGYSNSGFVVQDVMKLVGPENKEAPTGAPSGNEASPKPG